jgi:methionyl-tRNA formyltransferase
MTHKTKFVFFGTTPLKDGVLTALAAAGYVPQRCIESEPLTPELIAELGKEMWDVFIVASYGHKIPEALLKMPAHGVVNVHPSLLPRLRGASPIRSAILQDEKETGVSLIVLDSELDHGPLIAQKKIAAASWPPHGRQLDALLAREGGMLLAQMLPLWLDRQLEARPQNDDLATFCRSFKKEDGLLDLSADAYQNLLKIRALEGWPGTYAFFERSGKRLRVQILDAHLEGKKLAIDTVKPEGKKEMGYKEFLNSGARPA